VDTALMQLQGVSQNWRRLGPVGSAGLRRLRVHPPAPPALPAPPAPAAPPAAPRRHRGPRRNRHDVTSWRSPGCTQPARPGTP